MHPSQKKHGFINLQGSQKEIYESAKNKALFFNVRSQNKSSLNHSSIESHNDSSLPKVSTRSSVAAKPRKISSLNQSMELKHLDDCTEEVETRFRKLDHKVMIGANGLSPDFSPRK